MSRRPPVSDAVGRAETTLQRALRIGDEHQRRKDASIGAPTRVVQFDTWYTPEVKMMKAIFEKVFNRHDPRIEQGVMYLVDGSNVFFPNKPYRTQAILDVVAENGGAKGPCVVVSNYQTLRDMKSEGKYQAVLDALLPMTGKEYPILFCHVGVLKCGVPTRGGRLRDDLCLKRNHRVQPEECTYTVSGVSLGPAHKYCEFDDILLTRLFTVFSTKGYFPIVVSKDNTVKKETDVMGDVSSALRKLGASVVMGVELEDHRSA